MNGRRLYQEIGGVDEQYLQQAALYRAKRKKPVWRAVLIAAALGLVASLVIGTLAMSLGITLIGWLSGTDPDPEQPVQPEVLSSLAQMEDSLILKQTLLQGSRAEELDLFGGSYTLIWRENGSDTYYSVSLSKRDMSHMLYLMQQERTEFGTDSEQPSMQIWICMGDGLVLSPYLKNSAGNTGHGEVFDYDPELELSDELVEWISYCAAS